MVNEGQCALIANCVGGDLFATGTKYHTCIPFALVYIDCLWRHSLLVFQPKARALQNDPITDGLRRLGWAQGRSEGFVKSLFGTPLLARSRVVLGAGNLLFGLLQPDLQTVHYGVAVHREDGCTSCMQRTANV